MCPGAKGKLPHWGRVTGALSWVAYFSTLIATIGGFLAPEKTLGRGRLGRWG